VMSASAASRGVPGPKNKMTFPRCVTIVVLVIA
jgi:hypothetical protein